MGVQGLIDNSLGSIVARKLMYVNKMGDGRTLQAVDKAGERQSIADDRDGNGSVANFEAVILIR